MKVVILRGLPGAGKTTYVSKMPAPTLVVSADHYFVQGQAYRFDADKLAAAHAACLRQFLDQVQAPTCSTLVVDNTNICAWEIAPYYAAALAYRHDVEIVTIRCRVEVAAARNTHQVPAGTIQKWSERMGLEERAFPPFWRHRTL